MASKCMECSEGDDRRARLEPFLTWLRPHLYVIDRLPAAGAQEGAGMGGLGGWQAISGRSTLLQDRGRG